MNNEKTIITLDASRMSTHTSCGMKYNLLYNENLNLAGRDEPDYFTHGTAMHKLLEFYYGTFGNFAERTQGAILAFNNWLNESKEISLDAEAYNFITMRFLQYCAFYQHKDFIPLKSADGKVSTEVGFSKLLYEDAELIYIVEGRIDLIANFFTQQGHAFLVDHKTQSKETTHYQYTPQFLTYAWATNLRQMVINYIGFQKNPPKEGFFRRQLLTFPEHIITEWEFQMLRIFNSERDQRKFGYNKNRFECGAGWSQCQFTKICDTQSEMRESIIKNYYKTVPAWRPW